MNACEFDVGNLMESLDLGVQGAATGWVISLEVMPDQPITAITLYSAPSPNPTIPGNAPADQNYLEFCHFQIMVRSTGYTTTWDKILEVAAALSGTSQYLVTEVGKAPVKYSTILRYSDFLVMPQDEKGLFIRTVSMRAIRQELFAD